MENAPLAAEVTGSFSSFAVESEKEKTCCRHVEDMLETCWWRSSHLNQA